MKCPRCVQELQNGIAQCPHCGFSIAYLDAQFGEDAVVLDRLTDAADCIDADTRQRLEQVLDRFETQFPQLFIAIYVGALPEMTDIRQFAFWLLNRATVPSLDHTRPNKNGALLVLDLNSMAVSFTLGYFIEPYFSDHELLTLLRQGHSGFQSGDYGNAILRILNDFSRILAEKARTARRLPITGNRGSAAQGSVRDRVIDESERYRGSLNQETPSQAT